VFTTEQTSIFSVTNLVSVQRSPAHEETHRSSEDEIADVLALGIKEMKCLG